MTHIENRVLLLLCRGLVHALSPRSAHDVGTQDGIRRRRWGRPRPVRPTAAERSPQVLKRSDEGTTRDFEYKKRGVNEYHSQKSHPQKTRKEERTKLDTL